MNTSSAPSESPSTIHVFSLNCWGLKYISKHRRARLTEIGKRLAALDPLPDIVGLQECWTQADFASIRALTLHFLPFGKFYYSGVFGGGLAILSKWPIEESNMVRYPLNGRPGAWPIRGDWFVGKGVACARIRYGNAPKDVAEVFCTHLHAPYEPEDRDSYLCHRTAQAWEIARLMRHATERGHLVIGLGDFNMRPKSLAHQLIETHGRVKDVWREIHPDSSLGSTEDELERKRGRPMPTADFNVTENGATCDSVLNTWRWNKHQQRRLAKGEDIHIAGSNTDPRAKRLDYIFFGSGQDAAVSGGALQGRWRVEATSVGMTERHPILRCSLSDHFSISATLTRSPAPSSTKEDPETRTSLDPAPFLSPQIYTDIITLTSTYRTRERNQGRRRLAHFLAQIGVSVGCLVAVWWSPHNYVAFILMLASTLGFGVGITQGLMGGLFNAWEERCLREFVWEMERVKEMAKEVAAERK
ncbi:MAG: phospholipase C type enzyme [Bathelium mastoideum]|nr:MAG: phospholipase C type enzyme [Bathelium mastoideum]